MKRNLVLSIFLFVLSIGIYPQSTIDKFRQYRDRQQSAQGSQKTQSQTVERVQQTVQTNTPQQMFEKGMSYFQNESYTEAVSWFKKAADLGNANAQFLLAVCYISGKGVTKSDSQAVNWFKRSAEQGHMDSQRELGRCYLLGNGVSKNTEQAILWCEKAANQGDVEAESMLGAIFYKNGNYEKAIPWLEKATDHGVYQAQSILGYCYFEGKGVPVDFNKAYRYLKTAAEHGDETAIYGVKLIEDSKVILSVDGNADIYVDNVYKGRGKWEGLIFPFGTHQVECRKESHRTTKQSIEVYEGEKNVYTLSAPTPIYGSLQVNTVPQGASVKCDGKFIGCTPLRNDQILIGKHKIELQKNYFKVETTEVEITEAQTTSKDFTLESRLPVKITTSPANVDMKMNGKRYSTPLSVTLPEGTYNIDIPRHYRDKGIQAKQATIFLDSLHLNHDIWVKYDNNYDFATFFGLDYDLGLQAVGVNFGSNLGKHFMFEINFFWGLQKSERIHWLESVKGTSQNLQMQSTEYSHWAVDLRMGPTFWCGPCLRISPELGAQYLKLRENTIGNSNSSKDMVKGGYISAIGSVRFRLSLSQHFGLHVTPEYKLNVSNKKVLPELSKDIDKWVNGFGVKAGLVYFFH